MTITRILNPPLARGLHLEADLLLKKSKIEKLLLKIWLKDVIGEEQVPRRLIKRAVGPVSH